MFKEVLDNLKLSIARTGIKESWLKAEITEVNGNIVVTFSKDPAMIESERIALQEQINKLP